MKTIDLREHCSQALRVSALLAALVISAGNAAAGEPAPCAGMVIEIESGGILDEGWSGRAHDKPYSEGDATSWAVLKRCSNNQAACTSDTDCGGGDCVATCDCGSDSSCELAGPVHQRHCVNNFDECSTNADCPSSAACVAYLGAPMPVVYDLSPTCVVTHFEGAASGTFDSATGDLSLSGNLRRRYFLGGSFTSPCPRCGAPAQNPQVGGEFVCEGGQFPGAACTVEAVTPYFGGTSSDCPPTAGSGINGAGTLFPLRDLGTDPKSKPAGLQCAQLGFTGNPLVGGSNPKCTDDAAGPVCTSNADCRRCTGDPTTKCTNQGDCTGKGSCSEAPDQPITCGFWCHCGFCNNDGARPCFDGSECAEGETCQKGTGANGQANQAQQRPNDCSADTYVCGSTEDERCKNTLVGSCSLAPYRGCSSNDDCAGFAAGTCDRVGKPCFESQISRDGSSSPLDSYCAFEDKSCSSNADCSLGGDFCVADSTRADLSALYCLPGTSSAAVNSVLGYPGPAAATLPAFAKVCRCSGIEPGCESICISTPECGNAVVDEGEACDGGGCCNENCTLKSSAATCRASAGTCDTAENCSGSSAACPADTFQASTTPCRASAGICDVAESCTGDSVTCPVDGFAPTSTACRASADDCDAAESCSGTAAACPFDADEQDGTACDDGNECTNGDECSNGTCAGTVNPECSAVCGNGTVEGDEACDDGNATFAQGEYCGVACVLIPCGKPTNSSGELPKSSDALFALRAAVDQVVCSPRVCSPDGNQTIVSSDALRILRAAVGQVVTLSCPTE